MELTPEPADRYFIPPALSELRKTIAEHGGLEVFFVGHPGEVTGKIQALEVLCRGNRSQVPAVLDGARAGDVVIHNHPSGHLVPSDPDLELASHFAQLGVGFLIVDNSVTSAVAVVRPFKKQTRQLLDPVEVVRRLDRGGDLARRLPGYEPRPGQLEMTGAVTSVVNSNGVGLVEAGTGTGKSLAYLLPAALYALANKEVVVIATHTITLQEQLFTKDAPLVQGLEGMGELRIALMKGRSNYVCNRKLEYYRSLPADLFDSNANAMTSALSEWYERTQTGTRSELHFPLPDETWEQLASDDTDCTRLKCDHYEDCFFFRARREAAGAHLLIANQHLLMADLVVRHETGDYKRAFVLPPYHRVVVDEAHHLEESATSFISNRLSTHGVHRILNRLFRHRSSRLEHAGGATGLLALLRARLLGSALPAEDVDFCLELIETRILPRLEAAYRTVQDGLADIALQLKLELADRGISGSFQVRVRDDLLESPLWREVIVERLTEVRLQLMSVSAALKNLLEAFAELPDDFRQREQQLALEAGALRARLEGHARNVATFLEGGENLVRWFELEKKGARPAVAICTSPIEVAELLHSLLFEPMKSVVLTSATLSVAGRFDYLKGRIGADRVASRRLKEASIASPFDFARQVYLGIPNDVPDPRHSSYTASLIAFLEEALLASSGGAFVLFTSYALLNAVHEAFCQRGRLPFVLLKQGEEGRHQLLVRFREEKDAVLLGTSSFWEGVDVQGDTLRLVAIPRLPFQVPSDPVQEARAEKVVERGGDPFQAISLPKAVLQFKQGFGRLIRHRADRGVVLVLDPRIAQKGYGRHFLDSLPGVRPVVAGQERILSEVTSFFRGELEPMQPPASYDSRGFSRFPTFGSRPPVALAADSDSKSGRGPDS